MTDAEFIREIAQPLAREARDYISYGARSLGTAKQITILFSYG